MFVDLLIAISCGLGGLMCGWIAYPSFIKTMGTDRPTGSESAQPSSGMHHEVCEVFSEQERLTQIANRLSLLTASVTASVNQHTNELQSASELIRQVEEHGDPVVLLQAMNRLLDASEIMRDQLATAENKLVEQNLLLRNAEATSFTDPLTQIANRRALDIHLEARVAQAAEESSTLMILDIDHFKRFNDTYGHIAGDEILKKVAGHLQQQLGHVGIVARYGGEEFIVVFDEKPMHDCVDLAETVRMQMGQQAINFQGHQLHVTASMGLAELITDRAARDSAEQWLHRADRALYKSKQFRDCGHAMLNDTVVRIHGKLCTSGIEEHPIRKSTTGVGQRPASAQEIGPLKSLPKGLTGLISGDEMYREFNLLSQTAIGVGHAFVAVVIRLDDPSSPIDDLQTIARTARAVLRSVDRIGLFDERTLVVAMPNIDHETAVQKADRIRANLIFADQDTAMFDDAKMTVSIYLCSSGEKATFTDMVRCSVRTLENRGKARRNETLTAWDR